jgi:hypothetical protein
MYTIIFKDRTEFHGGEPSESRWNEIPDKPIAELYYDLAGKKIYLKNYEAYNHLTKYAFHVDSQQQIVVAVIIMGLDNKKVKRFIFDFIQKKLIVDEVPINQEYNNKPASRWKAGLKNYLPENQPNYKIN